MTSRSAFLLVAIHSLLVACSSTTNQQSTNEGGVTDTGGSGGSSGSPTGGSSGSDTGGSSGASTGGAGATHGSGGTGGHAAGGTGGHAAGGTGGHAAGGSSGTHGSGGSEEGGLKEGGLKDGSAGDSGTGGNPGDGSIDVCSTCGTGSICVASQIIGGAFVPQDAGRCPTGWVPSDDSPLHLCNIAPTYECKKLPAACNTSGVAHCTCAHELCDGGDRSSCRDLSPTLLECITMRA